MGSYDLIVQSVLIAQGIEFKLQKRKSSKFSLHVFFNRLQQKGMDVSKLMKRFIPSWKIMLVIISEHKLDKLFLKLKISLNFNTDVFRFKN